MVLLDSGADISAIPKHMAELLSLDLNGKQEDAFGIGGKARVVPTTMNIEINKSHENYSFKIPVKVILEEYDFPPLIERAVFFDKFDITLKQKDKRVILKIGLNNFLFPLPSRPLPTKQPNQNINKLFYSTLLILHSSRVF
jgi:hypothetical protein